MEATTSAWLQIIGTVFQPPAVLKEGSGPWLYYTGEDFFRECRNIPGVQEDDARDNDTRCEAGPIYTCPKNDYRKYGSLDLDVTQIEKLNSSDLNMVRPLFIL